MKSKTLLLAILILMTGCENKNLVQRNWDKVSSSTTEDIFGIYFRNNSNGWAVTSDGNVLSTNDGCKTWQMKNLGDFWLEDIYFIDSDIGFAVGSRGAVFHTRDGGQTWSDESMDTMIWFYDIGFWDDEKGVLVGAGTETASEGYLTGRLFTTDDGGETWQEVYNDMKGLSDLFLRQPQSGWVASTGSVGSTTNGGENWEKNILGPDDHVRGCFFLTGQTGWVIGHDGLMAKTTDGGWSWQKQDRLTDRNLYAIAFTEGLDGIAVGEDGKMFLTINGGRTWGIDSNFVKSTLRDIQIVDEDLWICGDNGTLIHVHE